MSVKCILQGKEEWRAPMKMISNPNLLDNWYFPNPVNQRGQTEYTTPGYTIDRWVGNEIKLVNGAISIGAGVYFVQRIEQERFGDRINESITLSVLKKNGTFISGDVSNNNPLIADYLYCYFDRTNQAYPEIVIYSNPESPEPNQIVAVKLEFGPTQTLAFQDVNGNWVLNDPPPNYQLELLKCQRYQVFDRLESIHLTVAGVTNFTFLPTPTTLRAIPTIVGTPTVWIAEGNIQISGSVTVSIYEVTENGVILGIIGDTRACYVSMPSGCGLDANL